MKVKMKPRQAKQKPHLCDPQKRRKSKRRRTRPPTERWRRRRKHSSTPSWDKTRLSSANSATSHCSLPSPSSSSSSSETSRHQLTKTLSTTLLRHRHRRRRHLRFRRQASPIADDREYHPIPVPPKPRCCCWSLTSNLFFLSLVSLSISPSLFSPVVCAVSNFVLVFCFLFFRLSETPENKSENWNVKFNSRVQHATA